MMILLRSNKLAARAAQLLLPHARAAAKGHTMAPAALLPACFPGLWSKPGWFEANPCSRITTKVAQVHASPGTPAAASAAAADATAVATSAVFPAAAWRELLGWVPVKGRISALEPAAVLCSSDVLMEQGGAPKIAGAVAAAALAVAIAAMDAGCDAAKCSEEGDEIDLSEMGMDDDDIK